MRDPIPQETTQQYSFRNTSSKALKDLCIRTLDDFERMFPERKYIVDEVRAQKEPTPKSEMIKAAHSIVDRYGEEYRWLIEYFERSYSA
ncbi:MAG: hypothetical protein AAF741_02895 [Bacteroidota bacterium]